MHPDPTKLRWRTSSYSGGNGGECVEVANSPSGGLYVRDSKDRARLPHHFNAAGWRAFIQDLKLDDVR
jgi:hypothetical protein